MLVLNRDLQPLLLTLFVSPLLLRPTGSPSRPPVARPPPGLEQVSADLVAKAKKQKEEQGMTIAEKCVENKRKAESGDARKRDEGEGECMCVCVSECVFVCVCLEP